MKDIEWLKEKLEGAFIPYPEDAFVEWWIENDKLPKRYKEHPYKVCSTCKEELHITKYGIRRGRSERYNHLCIAALCMDCVKIKCRRERGVEETGLLYHGESPIGPKRKVYDGNAADRGRTIKLILMEYFNNCCGRCGYEGQPQQMDIDHLNPREKKMCLSTSEIAHSTPEAIIEEVLKCQMVCANCHRLISTRAEHHKESLTYFTTGTEGFPGEPKGILERMSTAEPDRLYLRKDS